jgi:mRNA-degrading endonuclease YafQ of YafQ-DinJ toxin-antitoxin module
MRLVKDENYQRKERKFFKKHSQLVDKYAEVLTKHKNNPFDSTLKTHKLKGELKEFYFPSSRLKPPASAGQL